MQGTVYEAVLTLRHAGFVARLALPVLSHRFAAFLAHSHLMILTSAKIATTKKIDTRRC